MDGGENMDRKVGIIGYGSMGKMLLWKFAEAGAVSKENLLAANRTREKLDEASAIATICESNAELAAKALDANLFIFPGHYIGKPDSSYSDREYEYQYNTVFNLPSSRNVDIIYAVLGTICSRADLELQIRFF